MNPTLRFLQKQGLKVSLPLLLLATACGDGGTTSAFQPNSGGAAGRAITAASQPNTNGMGAPSPLSSGLVTPNVTLPDSADQTSAKEVLPPSGDTSGSGSSTGANPGAGAAAGAAASVPEPAALAGLAIAAAGMIVIKRKQAA